MNYTFRQLPKSDDVEGLGRGDARQLCFLAEGAHAADAYSQAEGRRLRFWKCSSARSILCGSHAGSGLFFTNCRRRLSATSRSRRLPRVASYGYAACVRVSPCLLAGRQESTRHWRSIGRHCVWPSPRNSLCRMSITAPFVYARLRKPDYTEEDRAGDCDAGSRDPRRWTGPVCLLQTRRRLRKGSLRRRVVSNTQCFLSRSWRRSPPDPQLVRSSRQPPPTKRSCRRGSSSSPSSDIFCSPALS